MTAPPVPISAAPPSIGPTGSAGAEGTSGVLVRASRPDLATNGLAGATVLPRMCVIARQ